MTEHNKSMRAIGDLEGYVEFLGFLGVLPKREVHTMKMAPSFPEHCNGSKLMSIFTG